MKTFAGLVVLVLVGCGGEEPTFEEATDSEVIVEETTSPMPETSVADALEDVVVEEVAVDAPAETSPMMDAPADVTMDAGAASIACGPTGMCDPTTSVCCSPTGGGGATCIAKTASCAGGKLACSAQSNCPSGQSCCLSTAGLVGGSTCKGTCLVTEAEMCGTDTDCASGSTCKNLSGGFRTCQ